MNFSFDERIGYLMYYDEILLVVECKKKINCRKICYCGTYQLQMIMLDVHISNLILTVCKTFHAKKLIFTS